MRAVVALIILAAAAPALAQDTILREKPKASLLRLKPEASLIVSEDAIAGGLERLPPAQSSRDSLKNGVIVGAVIGAVAMGAFAGWLCHELQEPGEPTCWRSVPIGGLYGAAIGAGAGAGIDALMSRDPRDRAVQRPAARLRVARSGSK